MGAKSRILLPATLGIISTPLVVWDIYNTRVIESMGMAWDTGAPVWPYQTPDILLRVLNGPAYFVAVPLANLIGLVASESYVLVVPAILAWWWFVGWRLDNGLGAPSCRYRRILSAMLMIMAVFLLLAGGVSSLDAFRWWGEYGRGFGGTQALLLMRFLSPGAWSVALAVVFVVAAARTLSRRP
jgi:hypothetical protein